MSNRPYIREKPDKLYGQASCRIRAQARRRRATAALQHLRQTAHGEHVFPNRKGQPYQSIAIAFAKACRREKLSGTGVTPHTLRHTFCSQLIMAGVDLRTVQELGGWKDLSTLQRYAHPSPGHRRQAAERIAGEFHDAFHDTAVAGVEPRRA